MAASAPTRRYNCLGSFTEMLFAEAKARVRSTAEASREFVARKPSLGEGESNSSIDTFEYFEDSAASREPTFAQSTSTCAASLVAATRRAPITSGFEPPAVAMKTDVPRKVVLRAASSSGVIADEKPRPRSRNRPAAIAAVVNDPPEPTARSGRPRRRVIFRERGSTPTPHAQR